MNLRYIIPLIAVIVLFFISFLGAQVSGLQYVFGVFIPYLAIITFVLGFAARVIGWSRSFARRWSWCSRPRLIYSPRFWDSVGWWF